MTWRMARLLLLAFAWWWTALAFAQVPVPPLSGRVVDQTGTLSAEQQARLSQTLEAFERRKGAQLAVLIVPTTAPEPIESFALRVAELWKLGRTKVDDGAILVVAKNDRTLRIEVGYGLEGALTDATSKRIISELIVPKFKQQDFAGGIAAGIDQMIRVVDGEPLPAPPAEPESDGSNLPAIAPMAFMVALALGGILRAWMGRLPGALVTGAVVAGATWFMVGALSMALMAGGVAMLVTLAGGMGLLTTMGGSGRGHQGGNGGFSGGGGGFGGGGASGRW
jgi:uncharacterized protein